MNPVRHRAIFLRHKREQGVTMLLVAFTLIALIAMAALAIDVASLYVARDEAQRAANAAALAGAKMFVTSGFTTVAAASSTDIMPSDVCVSSGPGSPAAANRQAEAAAAQNLIAGQPATVQSINCDFTPNNPKITVTVQRTGLPTFFAKIWGRSANTVGASAIAEAYNPSGASVPITITGVKPWLVPNCDPDTPGSCIANYFVDTTRNNNVNSGVSLIGRPISLRRVSTSSFGTPGGGKFYMLDVPMDPANTVCPSPSAVSCNYGSDSHDYMDNIACTSAYQFKCGDTIGPSGPGPGQHVTAFMATGYSANTKLATRCLIHASYDAPHQGQDEIFPSTPVTIQGGGKNPDVSLQGALNISRSDSIVTVPLYAGGTLGTGPTKTCSGLGGTCGTSTTIIGFLQLGITQTVPAIGFGSSTYDFNAVILNVVGCPSGATATSSSPGNTSPVPVRLVH